MIDRRAAMACRGDVSRAPRARRRRFALWVAGVASLGVALGISILWPPRPRLLWNASASAPIGLYRVSTAGRLAVGDMVIARAPEPMRRLAARRHYLPANVPLVKRVAAGPGDAVCAFGREIFVNGRWITDRLAHDRAGRPMPWWSGCLALREDSLFLLMAGSPASFDGRYFGPTKAEHIVGKATLLWRR